MFTPYAALQNELAMKNKTGISIILILLLAALTAMGTYKLTRPHILILHSYDSSYAWTRDVNSGLHSVLDKHPDWSLRWHYMDLKRQPTQASRDEAGINARKVIDQWSPEILIAVDDDAQNYAARFYINRTNIKIVFAGINGEPSAYDYDKANNVTGILERKPLTAIREAIQFSNLSATLQAKAKKNSDGMVRLMHLGDQSSSVEDDDRFIRDFDWQPLLFTGSRLVTTFAEWQAVVIAAPSRADIVLISNYRRLARSSTDSSLVPPDEVVRWTQANSRLPLLGANSFFVEDGGMLAIGTSGVEQGKVAADMAARLLDGHTKIADIAQTETHQFVVFMRAQSLATHKLTLPEVYESSARAMGHYYED